MWPKHCQGLTFILILGLTLDRFLKIWSQFYFTKNFWGFSFKFSLNQTAAWSWPISNNLLIATTIIIVIGLLLYLFNLIKTKQNLLALAISLILIGATSNLFDRLVYDGVIDYISLGNTLNFNLADLNITSGCLLWLKHSLFTKSS